MTDRSDSLPTLLLPGEAVPKFKGEVDLTSLRLAPHEMFVLTRIDGVASVEELCAASGMSDSEAAVLLRRFVDDGILDLAVPARRTISRAVRAIQAVEPSTQIPSGPVELPDDVCAEVDRMYAGLSRLDLFELLGVKLGADRGAIRRAFAERAKRFHPDRYFGRQLGSYRTKLERVFQHMNAAATFLAEDAQRSAYEEVIRRRRETEAARTRLRDEEKRALDELGGSRDRVSTMPIGTPISEPAPKRPTGPNPPIPSDSARDQEILRMRVEESRRRRERMFLRLVPRQQRAQEFHAQAADRLRAGDAEGALSSVRLAVAFDPANDKARELLAQIQQRAYEERATDFSKRAEFEEKAGRNDAAALLWTQAAQARPCALFHRRAAESFVKASDLKGAKEHAIRSVELEPQDAKLRLFLADVYLGLKQDAAARAEAGAAARLDPKLEAARALLRRLGEDSD